MSSPEPWKERKTIALLFAILHHGMSNFSTNSVPAGWSTVTQTADKFREYLGDRNTGQGR